MKIKLCEAGDVFIMDENKIVWSPYPDNKLALDMYKHQEGIVLESEHIAVILDKVCKLHAKKDNFEMWFRQLELFSKKEKK